MLPPSLMVLFIFHCCIAFNEKVACIVRRYSSVKFCLFSKHWHDSTSNTSYILNVEFAIVLYAAFWRMLSLVATCDLWDFHLICGTCMWYVTCAICHGGTCDMRFASSCSSFCNLLLPSYHTCDTQHLICDILCMFTHVWYLSQIIWPYALIFICKSIS